MHIGRAAAQLVTVRDSRDDDAKSLMTDRDADEMSARAPAPMIVCCRHQPPPAGAPSGPPPGSRRRAARRPSTSPPTPTREPARISATIRIARSSGSTGHPFGALPGMTPSSPRNGVSGHAGASGRIGTVHDVSLLECDATSHAALCSCGYDSLPS